MDKFEKILDIIDHQEKYSDEEIREILQDEECRKLYQTMVEVDSALEKTSPIINIDEYFSYIDLMGIDISMLSKERQESFKVLIEILETKYGIEYVDAEN